MNYTCKKCGSVYDKKPRFCNTCGSYFIDANDPMDGKEWRGVIRGDGTLAESADTLTVRNKNNAGGTGSTVNVWGILALISWSIAVFWNIAGILIEEPLWVIGLGNFIFGIIAMSKAWGWMRKVAFILIIVSAILIFISLGRY